MCEQMNLFDLDIWSGRTYPEHSAVTKAKISESCLKKQRGLSIKPPLFLDLRGQSGQTADASWQTGGPLLGAYTMRSFGECHSVGVESHLSQILQENPHPKYSLSARACAGILRRAENRGKELPPMLKAALMKQSNGISTALPASMGMGGGYVPMIARNLTARYDSSPCADRGQNIVCIQGNVIDRDANCNGKGYREDVSFALNATDKHGVYALDRAAYNQDTNAQFDFAVDKDLTSTCVAKGPGAVFDARGNVSVPIAPTMTGDHQNRITDYTAIISFYPQMKAESQCYRDDDISNTLVNGTNAGYQNGIVTAVDARNGAENADTNGCLQAKDNGGISYNLNNVCRTESTVRRLTPLECERLQGFPDGWTDIGDWTDTKGKLHKASDSVRYKALGNSIALPFWQWLADRIVKQYYEQPTMASLFDGIGGFPLVFSRAKAFPVWASEIEEFPIAVTKIRIG